MWTAGLCSSRSSPALLRRAQLPLWSARTLRAPPPPLDYRAWPFVPKILRAVTSAGSSLTRLLEFLPSFPLQGCCLLEFGRLSGLPTSFCHFSVGPHPTPLTVFRSFVRRGCRSREGPPGAPLHSPPLGQGVTLESRKASPWDCGLPLRPALEGPAAQLSSAGTLWSPAARPRRAQRASLHGRFAFMWHVF